jgi:MFS family permease
VSTNGNGEWPPAPSWAYGPRGKSARKSRSLPKPKLKLRKKRSVSDEAAPEAPEQPPVTAAPDAPDVVPGPSRAPEIVPGPTPPGDFVPGPVRPPGTGLEAVPPPPGDATPPVEEAPEDADSVPSLESLLSGADEPSASMDPPAAIEPSAEQGAEQGEVRGDEHPEPPADLPAVPIPPRPLAAVPDAPATELEGSPEKPASRLRLLKPLRLRDFRLLWTGMTVSLLGDGVFLVAIAWQVYQLSNAPTALSIVGIAMSVPHVVLLLLGGVVSDRFDRRKVMVGADLIRGAAIAVLGFLSVTGGLELWHVMVLTAFYGAGTAFFGPAFDAIVPDVVPANQLAEANSLDQFVRPAAWRLAGPALGGFLIALWGAGGAFLFDALTFAISIVCILLMRPAADLPTEEELEGTAFTQVKQGFSFVRAHVWLWGTFLAATFAYLMFMGPTEVLLPFVIKNRLGGSASDLGFVFACGGIGAILAAIVMGQRGTPRKHITFIYVVWTLSTLAIAGYGLAHFTWQVMAACFAFNALETAGTIVWATTKQRLVPSRLLGRVSSFDWFISIGLLPVSFALTAPVAALIGARATLIGAGLLGGGVTFAFLFLPGMRDVERSGAIFADGDPGENQAEAAAEILSAGPDEHGLGVVGAAAPTP